MRTRTYLSKFKLVRLLWIVPIFLFTFIGEVKAQGTDADLGEDEQYQTPLPQLSEIQQDINDKIDSAIDGLGASHKESELSSLLSGAQQIYQLDISLFDPLPEFYKNRSSQVSCPRGPSIIGCVIQNAMNPISLWAESLKESIDRVPGENSESDESDSCGGVSNLGFKNNNNIGALKVLLLFVEYSGHSIDQVLSGTKVGTECVMAARWSEGVVCSGKEISWSEFKNRLKDIFNKINQADTGCSPEFLDKMKQLLTGQHLSSLVDPNAIAQMKPDVRQCTPPPPLPKSNLSALSSEKCNFTKIPLLIHALAQSKPKKPTLRRKATNPSKSSVNQFDFHQQISDECGKLDIKWIWTNTLDSSEPRLILLQVIHDGKLLSSSETLLIQSELQATVNNLPAAITR